MTPLGVVQLAAPKGMPHRVLGWAFVALMAVGSAFVHTVRLWGPFSPIHLLSAFTFVMLPMAVRHARRHDAARHRNTMLGPVLRRPRDRRTADAPARPHHARGGVLNPARQASACPTPAAASGAGSGFARAGAGLQSPYGAPGPCPGPFFNALLQPAPAQAQLVLPATGCQP